MYEMHKFQNGMALEHFVAYKSYVYNKTGSTDNNL